MLWPLMRAAAAAHLLLFMRTACPRAILPGSRVHTGAELEYLRGRAVEIARSSCMRVASSDGESHCLFQPQASAGYGGQFTRDYTYALINSPETAFELSDALWATEQIMSHQRADGLLPDMLAQDPSTKRVVPSYFGVGTLPCLYDNATADPGMPLSRPACCPRNCTQIGSDSAQFATFNIVYLAQLLENRIGFAAAASFMGKHLIGLSRALNQVPRDRETGLVWSSAANPRIGYGFQDTVALTGGMAYASVLLYEAAAIICSAVRRYDLNYNNATSFDGCAVSNRISQNLGRELWNSDAGMLSAASSLGKVQIDVWASAYAALVSSGWSWLHIALPVLPLLDRHSRDSVVAYLSSNTQTLFVAGQSRNLPAGQVWPQQYCVPATVVAAAPPQAPRCASTGSGYDLNPPGYYQNGGYWAVPMFHLLPALALNRSNAQSCALVREFVANVRCHQDINEWVDAYGLPRGVGNYSASANNVYAGAASLRCHSAASLSSQPALDSFPSRGRSSADGIAADLCANLSGRWNFSSYGAGHYDIWTEEDRSITASGSMYRTVRILSRAPGDDAWQSATATVAEHPSANCPAPTTAAGAILSFVYNTSASLGHVSENCGTLRS
eukprot:SAG31_NODE_749_length_12378_cov_8.688818_8_plen_615_part_00